MADRTLQGPQRAIALPQTSEASLTASQTQIARALGAAAVMRDAEASTIYLRSMAVRLSREPLDLVLSALEVISETERRPGEPGLPTLPRVLAQMKHLSHPLRHLREVIMLLARGFGREVDEDTLKLYEDTAGHRTDADIDAAYKAIRENAELRRLPTPGQFLAACGILRVRRDGSRA